jgi:hypothetical protein
MTTERPPKITIVSCDYWKGLYVNGKCVHQDHDISAEDALGYLGFAVETFEADYDWLDKIGGALPEKLGRVRKAKP